MPKVLLLASHDPSSELGGTVLFRSDVERTLVAEADRVVPLAKARLPNMVVIKDQIASAAERLVRALKQAPETRRVNVVVLLRANPGGAEVALRRSGASLVITGPVDPLTWDDRLEELLSEPRRRELRIPLRYVVWPGSRAETKPGTALNLSVRGMLLETSDPLTVGSTLELSFDLPGGRSGDIVGQVVRQEAPAPDARFGVDFIILRGDSRTFIETFVDSETRP